MGRALMATLASFLSCCRSDFFDCYANKFAIIFPKGSAGHGPFALLQAQQD